MFIVGELPLIAIARKDKVVIHKLEQYDVERFGKADRKEMSKEHIDLVKKELEKVIKEEPQKKRKKS